MEELTIKAAADYADKSTSWVRKKILDKELAAEKEEFRYGERWITTKKAIDDLLQQAKMEKEVVEVREIDKPVEKDKLINELVEATESRNKKLIDDAVSKVTEQFKEQNEQLQHQNELINKLYKKLDRVEKRQNRSLIDKLKQLFK